MIGKFFKSKEHKLLVETNNILETKIEKLSVEVRKKENYLKCKNDLILVKERQIPKDEFDWKDMEDKLKKLYSENAQLRKELLKINEIISNQETENFYYVEIEEFLSNVKYKDIIKSFRLNGINFVQSLTFNSIEDIVDDVDMKIEILKKYYNFLEGNMEWNLKTALIKGAKVSKIFSKYRRLCNDLNNCHIYYTSELYSYNLKKMEELNYSEEQKKEIIRIYIEYTEERKVN
ncbi:hypothetical protein [uncultured Cetobacterium sp.]|uniref:hypothetical protein n=1 Tax=uncultured Cetobacterium sp. TaxID=527638 RepID=UPI0026037DC2|nr:hypothetical protein [uncultured Cetobacterium sp.]